MNILLAFNSNYYMPALVLLQSLLVNNRWCRDIRVYVLYADLKPEEMERFSRLAEESGIAKAVFLPVGADRFQDAPLHLKWISRETYYRLLAQEMLPMDVERVPAHPGLHISAACKKAPDIRIGYWGRSPGAALPGYTRASRH